MSESIGKRVGAQELRHTSEWHALLAAHDEALAICRRRIVGTFTRRTELLDGLVDAVIAWESIFSGHVETQMRITLPSAKILAVKEDERAVLIKKMKDAYSLRSRLVHGGSPKKNSANQIRETRDQVVGWVVDLVRYLLRREPTLLDLSASQRSETVLLRG
ncbi:hypothetical protein ACQB6R_06035 [Propionibacteriaceae bacterium G1746]|uniref:hypothetical protein n=1 Tax=Aestuariimicrobium sp. G57 TaxID=3418485 RepID=UPI003C212C3B